MDYCGPAGIPHSVFLAWLESDQDKAIGWAVEQRRRCGSCGTYPDDWLDDQGRRFWPDEMPYHADSIRCYGCVEVEALQERIDKDHKHTRSFKVFLAPGPQPEPDEGDGRDEV